MIKKEDIFKKVISHSKEYGFIFPSSEIYDGLSAVYDYGQYGSELKENIKRYWWKSMVQYNENITGIDSAIFMHPKVWKASGHIDSFKDPMIDNKDSKKRYKVDDLIEDYIQKIKNKISKEIEKAKKRFGNAFDEHQFLNTNKKILDYKNKIEVINKRLYSDLDKGDLTDIKKLIEELGIVCPVSGSKNWTDVRQFNLMFSTQLGSSDQDNNKIYLRPETAQGIFVNFANVQKTARMKIPFGIAQTGKAFRNEIVARQFIFRMREFEQMEMEFFVRPGQEMKWFEYWKQTRMEWHLSLNIPKEKFRLYAHKKLAHYANVAVDIEYEFPFGFKEVEGIHSRTDFDLMNHQKWTGKKLQYFDPEINKSYVPYVIETSIGLDRMFLLIMCNSYNEEEVKNNDKIDIRTVLKLPPILAPVKVAVLPLVKKDGLPETARKIMDILKYNFMCQYDEKDAIGRRYRRQDAIGTPFCITIDHESLDNNTVTIRYRDSMKQERIAIDNITNIISEKLLVKV